MSGQCTLCLFGLLVRKLIRLDYPREQPVPGKILSLAILEYFQAFEQAFEQNQVHF